MKPTENNVETDPGIYSKLIIPRKIVSLSKLQAEFIYFFLKKTGITKTVEVGFSYGCSAAHIIAATGSPHYVIDPWQKEVWDNQGIKNLELLKLEQHLILQADLSHNALPELVRKELRFDFAFIDGDHKYDTVMIDFYYIDLLLNIDGYILFDDVDMEAIQAVVNWITTNRSDYKRIPLPANDVDANPEDNYDMLAMFQKIDLDERQWDHFKRFW